MSNLFRAISIRQPWAWLIVHGYKDIENRSWKTKYRGPVYIHAGKLLSKDEFIDAELVANGLGITIPQPDELTFGSIIGIATITNCVSESNSPWFSGAYGFKLKNATPLDNPIPYRGQLGFFKVKQN